jgi:hypothetical protein
MIGTPVTTVEELGNGTCRRAGGSSLVFYRGVEQGQMNGTGIIPSKTETVQCSTIKR